MVNRSKSKVLDILRGMEEGLSRDHFRYSPMGSESNSRRAKAVGRALNIVREQIDRLEK